MLGSMLVSSVLLVAVSGFSITGPGVNQCIAGDLPLSAAVVGCNASPCAVAQGEDAVFDIIFRAPSDSSSLTTTAAAYLTPFPIPIPYPLGEKSVTCNYLLNSSCPVKEGVILLYSLGLPIDPSFPMGVSTNVEFRILDDKQDAVACIRVSLVIIPPNSQ